jgi:hypothetical protein
LLIVYLAGGIDWEVGMKKVPRLLGGLLFLLRKLNRYFFFLAAFLAAFFFGAAFFLAAFFFVAILFEFNV